MHHCDVQLVQGAPAHIIEMVVMRVMNDGEGHSLVDVLPFMKAVTVEVNVSEFLHTSVDDIPGQLTQIESGSVVHRSPEVSPRFGTQALPLVSHCTL
jgi:hypothetical protein